MLCLLLFDFIEDIKIDELHVDLTPGILVTSKKHSYTPSLAGSFEIQWGTGTAKRN